MRIFERRQTKIATKLASVMVGLGLMLISFQNCKMATGCEGGGDCPASGEANSTASTSGSKGGPGAGRTPGSSSANLGGGSQGNSIIRNSMVLGGSGAANTINPMVLGGGGGGGSNSGSGSGGGPILGGGSGGSGGSGGNQEFRFLVQPTSKSVRFYELAVLDVSVTGGTPPYTFQWYKDDVKQVYDEGNYSIECSESPSCRVFADLYRKEGRYRVEVKDSNNRVINSSVATVSIVDSTAGCNAGNFVAANLANILQPEVVELFSNSRGLFLVSSFDESIRSYFSFDESGAVAATPISGLVGLTLLPQTPNAEYNQMIVRSDFCDFPIPRVNTPIPYPGTGLEGSTTYHRVGGVKLQCSGKKWKFIGNTCGWQADEPPPPPL